MSEFIYVEECVEFTTEDFDKIVAHVKRMGVRMKQSLFAVSLAASKKRENRVDHIAAFCNASTKEEAKEWAMEACLRQYPESDGWENHGISVGMIPQDAYYDS